MTADLFSLLIMLGCAVSIGGAVAFASFLFEPSDGAGSDTAYGDIVALPDDFEVSSFHGRKE